jgi:hypothetical protein
MRNHAGEIGFEIPRHVAIFRLINVAATRRIQQRGHEELGRVEQIGLAGRVPPYVSII